jgi:recombination protein RecA
MPRSTITTGSLSFDAALGGGWAVNHFIEVLGHFSVGKTLVLLKTIAANQRRDPNWTVVWFSSEDFNEDYALMLGVDLKRVILHNECIMEIAYGAAIEFAKTRLVDCIVIDSIPCLVPQAEFDMDMDQMKVALAARLTNKWLQKMNPHVKRSLLDPTERPITVFLVNQYRSKITSYGDPRTKPGGEGIDYYCYQRIELTRKEWLTNTRNRKIGQTIVLKNTKNKYSSPGRQGEVDAYFAPGNKFDAGQYDIVKDITSAGIAYDVIKKNGGTYTFGTYKWAGRPKLDAAAKIDGVLRTKLRKAVLAATKTGETEAVEAEQPAKRPARKPVLHR